jgi:hypothetical protein
MTNPCGLQIQVLVSQNHSVWFCGGLRISFLNLMPLNGDINRGLTDLLHNPVNRFLLCDFETSERIASALFPWAVGLSLARFFGILKNFGKAVQLV